MPFWKREESKEDPIERLIEEYIKLRSQMWSLGIWIPASGDPIHVYEMSDEGILELMAWIVNTVYAVQYHKEEAFAKERGAVQYVRNSSGGTEKRLKLNVDALFDATLLELDDHPIYTFLLEEMDERKLWDRLEANAYNVLEKCYSKEV